MHTHTRTHIHIYVYIHILIYSYYFLIWFAFFSALFSNLNILYIVNVVHSPVSAQQLGQHLQQTETE